MLSRFPFKRQIIILACCLILIGITVPIATFAKGSPPGEQKRTQTVHSTLATQGQPISITADCSSPQLLATLNKGDQLTATATLTSSDSGEQAEGEFLHILDASTNPATNLLTVDNNAGRKCYLYGQSCKRSY